MKKKLPIGIQSFEQLRENNCYYVDKTPKLLQLIDEGKYYFISRPRRFGKSLMVDTLQCLFEGRKRLFEGLHAENEWDWSTSYPVVRFGFGDGVMQNREQLDDRINQQLADNRKRLGLNENTALDIPGNFRNLMLEAKAKCGQNVVVLIDEYDKPILDNLHNSEAAIANREGLKNLYSVIKDADEFIKFALLTGVSKFSKVSLFSGLNNLTDITLTKRYSDICGYTDHDLDTIFAPELIDHNRALIRQWYNGYNWRGTSVYNPFDILLYFANQEFHPYWFESATPTFLVNVLKERQIQPLELTNYYSDHDLLGHFDVDHITTEALLFQTGYLTIKSESEPVPGAIGYDLSFPNMEVEISLNKALLPTLGLEINAVTRKRLPIFKALQTCDFAALETHLKSLYASIPHDWYRKNNIQNFEGHYASIFYSHFAALGLHVAVEDSSVNGKVDMAIQYDNKTFIFEFKVVADKPLGNALAQIKAKNYAQKYVREGWTIYGIGVEFSKAQRQVVALEAQVL